MTLIYGFVIFMSGGIFGMLVMCLMFAAKEADKHIEELNNNEEGG